MVVVLKQTPNQYIVRCPHCKEYLGFDEKDIIRLERSYTVQTYAGETYISEEIVCPNCGTQFSIN